MRPRLAVILTGCLIAGSASADGNGTRWTAGAGVGGFTESELRGPTDIGGTWHLRIAFGTDSFLGFEAGYMGSAQEVDAMGLDDDAILFGTALDALGRVNLAYGGSFNPFVYGGLSWRRYELASDVNTSRMIAADDLLEIPLGLALAYRWDHLVVEARGEFRPATFGNLIPSEADRDLGNPMHTWAASVHLGIDH